MTIWEALSFVAAALVLLAFYQKRMIPVVAVALGSNVAFIASGLALGPTPVWRLHGVPLPVNASRLTETLRSRHLLDGSRLFRPP